MADFKEFELKVVERDGKEASHLLSNPVFVSIFGEIRAGIHAGIEATQAAQTEKREYLYLELLALKRIEAKLKQKTLQGKMASKTLQSQKDLPANE